MLVRTLKPHFNGYGEAYEKAVGDEYDHPSPSLLIQRGKLEPVDGSDSQANGISGTGKKAGGPSESDGQKRPAKGGKGRARADGGRSRGKGS